MCYGTRKAQWSPVAQFEDHRPNKAISHASITLNCGTFGPMPGLINMNASQQAHMRASTVRVRAVVSMFEGLES